MTVYAHDKAMAHIDRLRVLHDGGQPNPVHVQIILSDRCSDDCAFCSYRISNYKTMFSVGDNHNPNRRIETPKAIEIIEDCARMGVKAIQFTGGGEPTIHPDFGDILRYTLDRGMQVAVVTNGVMSSKYDKDLARCLWVRVSIDAGCPETYMKIRRVAISHWNRMTQGMKDVLAARNSAGTDMTLGMGFVVTRDNWTEVVQAAHLAKELGADNFRISAMFQSDHERYYDGFHAEASEACRSAELLADSRFLVFNNFGDRVSDLEQRAPDYEFCGYQHFTTYIGGDLNVYRCCVTSYTERGVVGSLKDQTFAELWQSQAKRDDFTKFDARSCNHCMFNEKNRAIAQMVETLPFMHEAFV